MTSPRLRPAERPSERPSAVPASPPENTGRAPSDGHATDRSDVSSTAVRAGAYRSSGAYRRLGAWIGLIVFAFGVGAVLRAAGALPVDALPPLHAHARLLIVPLFPAVAVGLAGVVALPAAARRLPWVPLLVVSWSASAAWAVALQAPDGLGRPLTAPTEYLAGLPAMGDDPGGWLRGFTTHLGEYPTHVKGHPPLPMLLLWILQWTGMGGAGWAATVVIAVGASSTAAIAITVRAVAGEPLARRALPFVILAPAALWVATSMDAVFLGASAWATALLARASGAGGGGGPHPPWGAIPLLSSRPVDAGDKRFHKLWITIVRPCSGPGARPGSGVGAFGALGSVFAAGVLVGALPYLSYGLVTILALPLAVLVLTRPRRSRLVVFALGCAVVPVAFSLAGFFWWDGVIQTHAAWAAGAGSHRPYAYFLVGDLAVLALLIGPAAAGALPRLLRPALTRPTLGASIFKTSILRTPRTPAARLGFLVGAALLGTLALDLSGVTRGEVERIWLPYAAWMTAGAAVRRATARRMLLAQIVTALLVQALVKSPW